jgi:hypothetical protein
MPTYTNNLGIELIANGEEDGTWGIITNNNFSILDRAINGSVALTLTGTTSTLTTSDGTLSDGQYKALILGGSPSGTHTITIAPNDAQKIYFVVNGTAQSVVLTQGSGGNVTVPASGTKLIYSDGGGASAAVYDLTKDTALTAPLVDGAYRGNITAVSALDIDCAAGNYFTKTISSNSTFTFSNVPAAKSYGFTLEITLTSGTITWPAAVKFPSNATPLLSTGKTHLFMFLTDDGGSRWRGAALTDYDN